MFFVLTVLVIALLLFWSSAITGSKGERGGLFIVGALCLSLPCILLYNWRVGEVATTDWPVSSKIVYRIVSQTKLAEKWIVVLQNPGDDSLCCMYLIGPVPDKTGFVRYMGKGEGDNQFHVVERVEQIGNKPQEARIPAPSQKKEDAESSPPAQ